MSPGIIQMKKNATIIPLLAEEGWRDSLIEAGAPGWREALARSGEASIEVRVPSTNGRAQIHPTTASAFQITNLLICLNQATIEDPKTGDPWPGCSTA